MDENEEAGPVRRTRSAKAAKTPPVAKPVRHKPGPLSRRTRKKVVLMEVEVSDDDEDETPQENKSALDAAEEEKKVEEKLLESPDESNDSVDQKSINAEKGKDSKANKGDDEKHELNGNGQNSENVKLDDTVTVVFNDVEMLEEAEGETNTDENDASKDNKVTEEKMEVDDVELVEKPSLKTVENKESKTETQKVPKTPASSKKEESKLKLSIEEKSESKTPNNDESKTETPKQDEDKSEPPKKKSKKEPETEVAEKEESETEATKKDKSETETPKKNESKTEKPKKDEPKKEILEKVAEAEKSETAKSDQSKTDTPKKDQPKEETLKKAAEAEKPEVAQSVKTKTDIPKEVVVIIEKPKVAEEKKDSNEDKSSKASETVELKTDSTKKVEIVPEKVELQTTTPEDKPKETVPSKEIKPESTPEKVEPKTTPDKTEPKITPDEVKPETTSEKVKPETTSEKVKPETTSEKVKPETTSEKVKPETTSEKVKPETTSEKVKSETTSEKVKPQTRNELKEKISEEPSKSKNLEHEKPSAEVTDQKKSKPEVLADEKPKTSKVPEIQKSEPVKEKEIKEIKEDIKKEEKEEKISNKELKVEEPVADKGKKEKVLVTEVTKMEVDETPAEKTHTEEKAPSKDKLEEKKENDAAKITKEVEKTKPEDQVQKEEVTKEEKHDDAKQKGDPDAENISEDELPTLQAAKVPEAEEVSDEELPGPKRAELPADTEVVSEDELPTVKSEGKKEGVKRKLDATDYDPGSPTSENEAPTKKPSLEASSEKEKEEKPAKAKKLPELDKYWKAVNDDPTDFTGWTYLLQYVDQENDMEAAREAYDAFLSHYPYCYGYWRKYADYEKRKGNKKKCEEVFERGLKAIPLSVDLWIHYLTYVKSTRADDEEFIRSQFERSILACGLEFRSDRLWDSFIKWETEGKRLQRVTAIYDRLLTTPTQGYTSHFDNFQEHVASNPPNKVIEVDEFLALRKEVKHMLKHDVTTDTPADDGDAPPGDDDPSKIVSSDEETKSIRERIVSIRRKLHKATVNAVTARWNYEEGIKRPYFHVKPLERCQLKNWQDYLDYETEQGDRVRIIVLFERCLIACALYEEFWLKFVHYLESLKDKEMQPKIRDVYERACTIHHLKKPGLHLQWAMFEEEADNPNRAAEILVNLEKSVPNILQIAYRRINLERRRNDYEKCCQLYEHYINNSKNKMISSNIAIKYSRFCFRVMKDIAKAQEALKTAISKDPNNPRLYLQLIDLALQKENVSQTEVIEVIDSFLDKESTDIEQKVLFAQRKLEYVEDFGCDVQSVQLAYDQYQKILKQGKDSIKKKEIKAETTVSSKKEKPTTQSSSQSSTYNYGAYGNSSAQPSYPYSGSQQQGQNYYQQYGQGGDQQYQYQNWQYPQGGYGGYNQWGGYSGGYGY